MCEVFVERKRKHTVGLEPTISCSVGKRLIQLGYACDSYILRLLYFSYREWDCFAPRRNYAEMNVETAFIARGCNDKQDSFIVSNGSFAMPVLYGVEATQSVHSWPTRLARKWLLWILR